MDRVRCIMDDLDLGKTETPAPRFRHSGKWKTLSASQIIGTSVGLRIHGGVYRRQCERIIRPRSGWIPAQYYFWWHLWYLFFTYEE